MNIALGNDGRRPRIVIYFLVVLVHGILLFLMVKTERINRHTVPVRVVSPISTTIIEMPTSQSPSPPTPMLSPPSPVLPDIPMPKIAIPLSREVVEKLASKALPPRPVKSIKSSSPSIASYSTKAELRSVVGEGSSTSLGTHRASEQPISPINPTYPADMQAIGREGHVTLVCDIEPAGTTSNCIVSKSIGGSSFVREALRAAKKARYRPAMKNGVPIRETGHIVNIEFSLQY